MNKINVFLISIVIIGIYISNSSCNRNDYSEEIVELDSLSILTSTYLTQLDSIDSSAVMGMKAMILEDISWISDSLSKENLSESSVFLAKIKNGKKVMQVFPREYTTLKKELTNSLNQLNDLKADLSNGNLDEVHAKKFINDEKLAFTEINAHQKKLMKRLNSLNSYEEVRKEFYLMAHK